ncbi:MAG: NAD(P)H-hydrate epimerase [Coriobacteriales bacterium]|nr:NAD(P)H-hydrate epimerase [Coriobacteriales bacterium]
MTETLTHPWPAVYDGASRVLVLGTFPSPRSRAEGFYFGHPQNLFWSALADSLQVPRLPANATIADKTAMLLDNHVALWDVLRSCRIEGAADSSISEPVPHRFAPLLADSQIEAVFATGRTATSLFNRLAAHEAEMRAAYVPSTSPANRASQARPEFAQRWGAVGRVLRGEVVSALGMKAADRHTVTQLGVPSLELMERAARAVVHELLHKGNGFDLARVLCVCGTGNNGGDGLAAARLLHAQGVSARAVLVGDPERLTSETRQQLAWAREAGVAVQFCGAASRASTGDTLPPRGADASSDALPVAPAAAASLPEALAAIGRSSTLVDALFGIGIVRPLAGSHRRIVQAMNDARARSGGAAKVLAVDAPSGISADSGEVLGAAVRADRTVTFAYPKLGMTLEPGRSHAGQVTVADIGIVRPPLLRREDPGR